MVILTIFLRDDKPWKGFFENSFNFCQSRISARKEVKVKERTYFKEMKIIKVYILKFNNIKHYNNIPEFKESPLKAM